jgi:hypothetical protein
VSEIKNVEHVTRKAVFFRGLNILAWVFLLVNSWIFNNTVSTAEFV